MPTFVLIGHPLNYGDIGLTSTEATIIRHAPLGSSITLNLTPANETKLKGHGVLR